jgi:hypothetical protein
MFARTVAVAGLALGFAQAETLDRIAVSMGQDVITESQLILDLRVVAFLDRKPVNLSGAARRESAQRLVDQILIRREAAESHMTLPSTEAAAGLVAPYAAEKGFPADLKRYGISESDLAAHLLAGLRMLTFTDLRFRPDIQISADEVRAYYDGLSRQSGPAAPLGSFDESREQIEKLLLEQRVLEALDKWLETARTTAKIRYRDKAFE